MSRVGTDGQNGKSSGKGGKGKGGKGKGKTAKGKGKGSGVSTSVLWSDFVG